MPPIQTESAPTAIGPHSQAIRVGELLFVSDQLPIDPATGEFAATDAVGQSRQCLANIAAIASASGTDRSGTVKTTILLTDLSGFAAINEEYGKAFFRAISGAGRLRGLCTPQGRSGRNRGCDRMLT